MGLAAALPQWYMVYILFCDSVDMQLKTIAFVIAIKELLPETSHNLIPYGEALSAVGCW
jgi:hypothetical protein